MNDNDIIINVYRSRMNSERYVIRAYYKNNDSIDGESWAENDFISKLRGRSLEDEIKLATCEAIKKLKCAYEDKIKNDEYMTFIKEKAQSYVKFCMEKEHERE